MKKINDAFTGVEPAEDNHEYVEANTEPDMEFIGDSMTLYLNEIGGHELLSAEEECELARIVSEGGRDAVEARNRLVEANLKLVMFFAKKYVGRGVDIEDLNTMGIEGLIRAAEKFDYTRGFRFSTYAAWWIMQAIVRGIADEGALVRVAVRTSEHIGRIVRIKEKYTQTFGFEPSIEELAELAGLTEAQVKTALEARHRVVSFDMKIGEDGESTLEELIADDTAVNPCDKVVRDGLKDAIRDVLELLDPKEARVIALRNGIGGGRAMTLEQIANLPEFGVTRERIRQIESKAYRKIKHNPRIMKLLKDYVA